ncbi:TetR/AcrR family transcriptional regulator [Oxalobacteraceae bacterium OM1]|nr:TetR/AcrR family transcriptional regulator [Oxalobacteraceae bacterium OM1]
MPAPVISRDEAVDRIIAVFRQYGYEGASLTRLSEATGLGRSSLYHHFPNGKVDMAQAALDSVRAWLATNVFPALSEDLPPEEKLRKFTDGLAHFYRNGERACLTDLFTMGEAGELFQEHFAKGVRALIKAIARVVQEAGFTPDDASTRAEDAVIAIQGALIVSRALGDQRPFQRVMRDMTAKLLAR